MDLKDSKKCIVHVLVLLGQANVNQLYLIRLWTCVPPPQEICPGRRPQAPACFIYYYSLYMWQMLPTFLSSEPCIFKACKPWSLEAAFRTSVEEILITLGQLLSIHQKPVLKLQNKQKIGFLSFKLQRCSSRPSRNRLVE